MAIARRLAGVLLLLPMMGLTASGQGLALFGVGPVNQSMGGAGVAAPLDVAGAIYWNPAGISGLAQPEAGFGATLPYMTAHLSSETVIPAPLSGSDRSDSGVSPIPYAAFATRRPDSALTYGVGILGVGGFRTNYPASDSNPVLTPQPPLGVGVGGIAAEAEIMQFVPTLSYAVSESVAIGFAPTVSIGRVNADPLLLADPDDANGDGSPTFPSGRGSRHHWGGGFQVGGYYIRDDWHYGVSFKSPQWFERFRYKTVDELGRPETVALSLEYPAIVSLGTAYTGIEGLVAAFDLRYLAYESANGLGDRGFTDTGALAGFGWRDIMAVSVGLQKRLHERAYVRAGYAFNENPIPSSQTAVNVGSPVIVQHYLNLGASFQIDETWILSATYTHGFRNSISGPIQTPGGPLPGSRVRSEVSVDGLSVGMTFHL